MDTFIENSFCRCCSSEGTFKDVSTKYHWMGEEEIYADMLKECFNIILSTAEESRRGICELCISQLRSAANFKKQVLHTENQFKKMLENKQPVEDTIEFVIKSELETQDGDVSDDNDNVSDTGDPDYVSPDFDVSSVKEETEEPPRPTKRAAQPSTSRAKKPKTEQPETSAKRVTGRIHLVDKLCRVKLKRIQRISDATHERQLIRENKRSVDVKKRSDQKITITNLHKDIQKHRRNIQIILQYTNATPFRKLTSDCFICSFCTMKEQNPEDLKQHTLKNHREDFKHFMSKVSIFDFIVNLDITDLDCNLCNGSLNTLDEAMIHLKEVHVQKIFTDINNQILPFKFDGTFKCVYCSNTFNNFKVLLNHMNCHYTNYCCDVCPATFVVKRALNHHKYLHVKGEHKCPVCGKTFENQSRYLAHIRVTHVMSSKNHKCHICGDCFSCYSTKMKHMAIEHGFDRPSYMCKACEKTFSNSSCLAKHVRRDHLLERFFKCKRCDKTFFDKRSLVNHMVTHTGEREYRCDYCFKKYTRKCTLREHLRIHENDRRFKCDQCRQTFVQKCSWKSHMRTKHSQIVF